MGFFDLTASSQRKFAGVGLTIESPVTQVEVTRSKHLAIDAKSRENVAKIIENLIKSFNLVNNFSVRILQAIPEHSGLGSGTQMALSLGIALNQLFGLNLTIEQIARDAMRGKRSGIGIGAFTQGGFMVDSGKNTDIPTEDIPSIAARYSFPNNWHVLLVLDSSHTGIHGLAEQNAFQILKPAPHSLRAMLEEQMLPALQRADLLEFGAGMQALQAYNGDYFSSIQGGRYASNDVAEVLDWLQKNGAVCVGQSSWGPTGFAVLETLQQAENLQVQAQLAFSVKPNISFEITRGKNTGATILNV